MIDAYEIGIQLLLQDDVSAGLAVINRGLAEVDRAIAATSANLAGLVNEAGRTAKAVAVAVGAKMPQMVATEPRAATAVGDVSSGPAKESSTRAVTAAPAKTGRQREDEPPMPLKAALAGEQRTIQVPTAPSVVERISTPIASAKLVGSNAEQPEQRVTYPAANIGETALARKGEGVASAPNTFLRRTAREVSSGEAARRQGPTHNSTLAITAAIGPSRAVASSTLAPSRAEAPMAGQSAAELDRSTAAPWSTGNFAMPQPSSARPTERAAAPQSPGRERAEGGGGAVMLDGRLVGQWLSEHMAREASRPPSGTNFFDARQTPAWNVSGAL